MDLCAVGRSADIFFFSSSFNQKDKNSKQKDSKQPPVLSCWRKKGKITLQHFTMLPQNVTFNAQSSPQCIAHSG